MGVHVTEDELRLYLLCANQDRLDMDRVRAIVPVKGPAKPARDAKPQAQPPPSSDDEFDFGKAVRAYRGDRASGDDAGVGDKKSARPPRLSGKLSAKPARADRAAAPPGKVAGDSSDGDSDDPAAYVRAEVNKRLQAVEWQQLHTDITRLIRATGSTIKPPRPGTPITDMRRIKDYLAKEADIPQSVESTLNFFISTAPMIEKVVTSSVPFIKLQGWAGVLESTRDFLRGPLESIFRSNMLSFGYSMSPLVTICVLVFGSMAATIVANWCGSNPAVTANRVLRQFGGLVGITAKPPPAPAGYAGAAAPAFAQSPSGFAPAHAGAFAPSPVPPPPPVTQSQPAHAPSRPTLAEPVFD